MAAVHNHVTAPVDVVQDHLITGQSRGRNERKTRGSVREDVRF